MSLGVKIRGAGDMPWSHWVIANLRAGQSFACIFRRDMTKGGQIAVPDY